MREVRIVYGAPGAGKSNYVAQNKLPDDVVFDLDFLASAFALEKERTSNQNAYQAAMSMKETFLYLVKNRSLPGECFWIITTNPDIELAKSLNAKLIHIDTSKDVCVKRVLADSSRKNKDLELGIIDKYFATSRRNGNG